MKVEEDDIKEVLALFDKEDIKYINFEYLINNKIIEMNMTKRKIDDKVKVRKKGDEIDRKGIDRTRI